MITSVSVTKDLDLADESFSNTVRFQTYESNAVVNGNTYWDRPDKYGFMDFNNDGIDDIVYIRSNAVYWVQKYIYIVFGSRDYLRPQDFPAFNFAGFYDGSRGVSITHGTVRASDMKWTSMDADSDGLEDMIILFGDGVDGLNGVTNCWKLVIVYGRRDVLAQYVIPASLPAGNQDYTM